MRRPQELRHTASQRVGELRDIRRRRPLGEYLGNPVGRRHHRADPLVLAVGAGDHVTESPSPRVEQSHESGDGAEGHEQLHHPDETADDRVPETCGPTVVPHDP